MARLQLAAACAAVAVAAIAGAWAATGAAPAYTIVDLGTLGGASSHASAIDASGEVVGWAQTETGATHAFLWSDGAMRDLGTFGGSSSKAFDVDAAGDVVGIADTSNSAHGFLYRDGTLVDLGINPSYANPFQPGWSEATAIDDAGTIVGATLTSSRDRVAFVFRDGLMTIAPCQSCFQPEPAAINADGVFVGSDANPQAVEWTADGAGAFLDTGRNRASHAFDVNADGLVAGSRLGFGGPSGPVVYDHGTIVALGTLGGFAGDAEGIDDAGDVVGWSTTAEGDRHAFLWSDGTMTDLNSLLPDGSGWTLTEATDLNADGAIAGVGLHDGAERAFLLAPARDTTPPVLSLPGNLTAPATGPDGAVVAFAVSASDPDDAASEPVCSPSAGSTFPIGTTTVTCASSDTHGKVAAGSFTVHVEGADEQLADLRAGGLPEKLDRDVGKVQRDLEREKSKQACVKLAELVRDASRDGAIDVAAAGERIAAVLGC